MSLENKHIVIAGGNSGIGFAVAAEALKQKAQVTVVGRSAEKLLLARTRLGSDSVSTVVMDIGDAASAEAGFKQIGNFDHFVSTAADLTYAPLAGMESDAIERMLAGKFWGPINFVKYGAPQLLAGGSILFFSGLAADRPTPGTSIVAALNASVEGFTRALAVELAPIRVNAISPGIVNTEGWHFMDEATRSGFFQHMEGHLPARKIGAPEHLAEAAVFALNNAFLTGEVIRVNGGGNLV